MAMKRIFRTAVSIMLAVVMCLPQVPHVAAAEMVDDFTIAQVTMNNAQDAISLIMTAEGALTEIHAMLERCIKLSVLSANRTDIAIADIDRGMYQREINDLLTEMTRVAQETLFSGMPVLSGSYAGDNAIIVPMNTGINWWAGPEEGIIYPSVCHDHITLEIDDMSAEGLGVTECSVLTAEDAANTLDTFRRACSIVNRQRSKLGAMQSALGYIIYCCEWVMNGYDSTGSIVTTEEDGTHRVELAEGVLSVVYGDILARVDELLVHAPYQSDEDKQYIQIECDTILGTALNIVADLVRYNGALVFDGSVIEGPRGETIPGLDLHTAALGLDNISVNNIEAAKNAVTIAKDSVESTYFTMEDDLAIAETFSVIVPTSLPLYMSGDGTVTTASAAMITNHSEGSIAVTQARVTPKNGWELVPDTTDFRSVPVDSEQFSMSILGTSADPRTGICDLADVEWVIEPQASLPLSYGAKVSAQQNDLETEIAEVVFVIRWAPEMDVSPVPELFNFSGTAEKVSDSANTIEYVLNIAGSEGLRYTIMTSIPAGEIELMEGASLSGVIDDTGRKDLTIRYQFDEATAPHTVCHTFSIAVNGDSNPMVSFDCSVVIKPPIIIPPTNQVTITYMDRGSQYGQDTYNKGTTVITPGCANGRNGYTFAGWDTSSSATTICYYEGDEITISADCTLYAVWKPVENHNRCIWVSIETTLQVEDTISFIITFKNNVLHSHTILPMIQLSSYIEIDESSVQIITDDGTVTELNDITYSTSANEDVNIILLDSNIEMDAGSELHIYGSAHLPPVSSEEQTTDIFAYCRIFQ